MEYWENVEYYVRRIVRSSHERKKSSLRRTWRRRLRRAGVARVQISLPPPFPFYSISPLHGGKKKIQVSAWASEPAREGGGGREGRAGKYGERRRIRCWKGKERDGRMRAGERKTRKAADEREKERGGWEILQGSTETGSRGLVAILPRVQSRAIPGRKSGLPAA